MRVSRSLLAVAGVGLAGIAVAGVGAGATFEKATTSTQQLEGGTLGLSVYVPGAAHCGSAGAHCESITLPDVGPVGSTFETTPTVVYVKNTGNIPATYKSFQLSATPAADDASANLLSETNVCLISTDPNMPMGVLGDSHTWVEGNGPLTTATSLTPTVQENPVVLQPGDYATYKVDFYAGKDSACGTTYSDGSHTRNAWDGAVGHPYQTPASLNNDAMGGVMTATLTFNVTG